MAEVREQGIPAILRTRKEILQFFGISRYCLNKWISDGAPIFMVGSKMSCSTASLIAWLEKNRPAGKTCQAPKKGTIQV